MHGITTAPADPVRADFALIVPLRVRYNETDQQGVVFNANYLVYADIAVSDYFRLLAERTGADRGPNNPGVFGPGGESMVRHAEVDFRASARSDDEIAIGIRCVRFGRTSFEMLMAIWRDDELLTVIRQRAVHVHNSDWRPRPLPDVFRDAVTAFEVVAPIG